MFTEMRIHNEDTLYTIRVNEKENYYLGIVRRNWVKKLQQVSENSLGKLFFTSESLAERICDLYKINMNEKNYKYIKIVPIEVTKSDIFAAVPIEENTLAFIRSVIPH